MLEIEIPGMEYYDEEKNEFTTAKSTILLLEYSLFAIAKWESKWKKAFLGNREKDAKTFGEYLDFIKCMTTNYDDVDDKVYSGLTNQNFKKIEEYINDPMTAAWFREDPNKVNKNDEIITADLVYYWMVVAQIPFECQYWHFNRLMTLIKIYGIKNQPEKQMSQKDVLRRNQAINAARRKPRIPHK